MYTAYIAHKQPTLFQVVEFLGWKHRCKEEATTITTHKFSSVFLSILDEAEKENVYENKEFHFENCTREEFTWNISFQKPLQWWRNSLAKSRQWICYGVGNEQIGHKTSIVHALNHISKISSTSIPFTADSCSYSSLFVLHFFTIIVNSCIVLNAIKIFLCSFRFGRTHCVSLWIIT